MFSFSFADEDQAVECGREREGEMDELQAGAENGTVGPPEGSGYAPFLIQDKYLERVTSKHCKRLAKILDKQDQQGGVADPRLLRALYERTKTDFEEDLQELENRSKADYQHAMENLEKWLYVKQYVTDKEEVALLAVKDVAMKAFLSWLQPDSGGSALQRLKQLWTSTNMQATPTERTGFVAAMRPLCDQTGDSATGNDDERGEIRLRYLLQLDVERATTSRKSDRRSRLQSTPH